MIQNLLNPALIACINNFKGIFCWFHWNITLHKLPEATLTQPGLHSIYNSKKIDYSRVARSNQLKDYLLFKDWTAYTTQRIFIIPGLLGLTNPKIIFYSGLHGIDNSKNVYYSRVARPNKPKDFSLFLGCTV